MPDLDGGVDESSLDAAYNDGPIVLLPAQNEEACKIILSGDLQQLTTAEISEIFGLSQEVAAQVERVLVGTDCTTEPQRLIPNADCLPTGSSISVPPAGAPGSSYSVMKSGVYAILQARKGHRAEVDGTEGVVHRFPNECGHPQKKIVINGTEIIPAEQDKESSVHYRIEGDSIRLAIQGSSVYVKPEGEELNPEIHPLIDSGSYVMLNSTNLGITDLLTTAADQVGAELLDAGANVSIGGNPGEASIAARPRAEGCDTTVGVDANFLAVALAAIQVARMVRSTFRNQNRT